MGKRGPKTGCTIPGKRTREGERLRLSALRHDKYISKRGGRCEELQNERRKLIKPSLYIFFPHGLALAPLSLFLRCHSPRMAEYRPELVAVGCNRVGGILDWFAPVLCSFSRLHLSSCTRLSSTRAPLCGLAAYGGGNLVAIYDVAVLRFPHAPSPSLSPLSITCYANLMDF